MGMMRAWTRIVACGTASWVRAALGGRELRQGDVEGVARGAVRYAAGISGTDYLDAVNKVHAYGRQMAACLDRFDVLVSPTLAEPPAAIGRFDHASEEYEAYRIGPDGVFAYSPFCASFNASGQPAASVPLHWTEDGLPVGVHLAAAMGADETLMALCAQLEEASPWAHRRPPLRQTSDRADSPITPTPRSPSGRPESGRRLRVRQTSAPSPDRPMPRG